MSNTKKIDWADALRPLLERYRGEKHPLNYHNEYELMVMVILSARGTDKIINEIAEKLFAAYPSIKDLAKAKLKDILKFTKSVPGSIKKSTWLLENAKKLAGTDKMPNTMKELRDLKGIGRKSANVIIRESGGVAEGIIVDLHVLRVAPRLGIAEGENPVKIEQQLMKTLPHEYWGDIGMAFSFLGREICRPTNPKCPECPVNTVCDYYEKVKKEG